MFNVLRSILVLEVKKLAMNSHLSFIPQIFLIFVFNDIFRKYSRKHERRLYRKCVRGKIPSMFWLAGTVTVEQKDAVNNALYFKKVFKGGSCTEVSIKKSYGEE